MHFITQLLNLITLIILLKDVSCQDEPESRIIGGQVASKNKYVTTVHIIVEKKSQCGGTLIANNYVLTAGHCITSNKPEDYKVRGNVEDLNSFRADELLVKSVTIHPNYDEDSLANDIALIEVIPNNNLSKYLNLDTKDDAKVGNKFVVVGWGRTKPKGPGSKELKELELKVLDPNSCIQHLGSMNTSSHFCAAGVASEMGGSISGACQGDSGSPVLNLALDTVVGIVSHGSENCDKLGAAFTRVFTYKSWIDSVTNKSSTNKEMTGAKEIVNGGQKKVEKVLEKVIDKVESYPKGSCKVQGDTICYHENQLGVCIDTKFAFAFNCPYNSKCKISELGKGYCTF